MGETIIMDRAINSKAIVFGLPTAIFLTNLAITAYSRDLIIIISPWMHFAGGFSMGLFFLHFFEENLRLSEDGKRLFFSIIAIVAFAVLIGVLWEFLEFTIEKLFPELKTQLSLSDTIADLFLDFLGGLLIAVAYSKSKLYKESFFNK